MVHYFMALSETHLPKPHTYFDDPIYLPYSEEAREESYRSKVENR